MSTPFDDDALQESLGHTFGGILSPPRTPPGLAQALTGNQECVAIYGYPGLGSNRFGHIGFSKDGGPIYGKTPEPGHDRRSLVETVPGHLEQVGANRQPNDYVRICGIPKQIDAAYQYWLDPRNSQEYFAPGNNCSTLIPDGLRRAGLPAPAGNMVFPTDLMKALHAMYDSGEMDFQGTRP